MKITHKQGNILLSLAGAGLMFPEKLGKEEYETAHRAFADDEMRAFRKLLLAHSEMWALKRKVLFGRADNWKQADEKGDRWTMVDEDLEVEIRLDGDEEAERGLYWFLLLMLHPGSPFRIGIDLQEDVAWALAEKLGYRNDLRDATGLSQRKLPRLPKKDSDPSWRKASKKVELDAPPAAAAAALPAPAEAKG